MKGSLKQGFQKAILVPFDFVCVCLLCARTSCRLQSMKDFLCEVWIPTRGSRTRLHEWGAVLWRGISSRLWCVRVWGWWARWVLVIVPASPCAPVSGHSQGRTRCSWKTERNSRFALSSFSLPCKLAAHSGVTSLPQRTVKGRNKMREGRYSRSWAKTPDSFFTSTS